MSSYIYLKKNIPTYFYWNVELMHHSFQVDVNGSGAAPLYQFLKHKQSGTLGSAIKWNFTKFLVNKDGVPVDRYAPTTDPMDIAKDIEKLL